MQQLVLVAAMTQTEWILLGVLAIVLVSLGIGLIALMADHQRDMAKIMRGNTAEDIEELRRELKELRALIVGQQAKASLEAEPNLQERVSG